MGPDEAPATADAMVRRTRTQSLADRLVAAIAVGAFSPGERLPPERELARLQAVSRVTVRDALKHVAELGLIEARRGREGGTFVTRKDWRTTGSQHTRRVLAGELARLSDLFDYRCLIEATVARTAAVRGTADQRDHLHALLLHFTATREPTAARELDRRLHQLVTAMTQNDHLKVVCRQLTAEATLGFAAEPYPVDYLARAGREHTDLVKAVIEGRADEAADIAFHHFTLTREILEAGLEWAQRAAPGPDQPRDASVDHRGSDQASAAQGGGQADDGAAGDGASSGPGASHDANGHRLLGPYLAQSGGDGSTRPR